MAITRTEAQHARRNAPIAAGTRRSVRRVGRLRRYRCVDDLFADFDVDRDGRIGREDALATGIPEDEFRRADRNRDGYLDVNEFYAWLRGTSERRD